MDAEEWHSHTHQQGAVFVIRCTTPLVGRRNLASASSLAVAVVAFVALLSTDSVRANDCSADLCTDADGNVSYTITRLPNDATDCTWSVHITFGDGTSGDYYFSGAPVTVTHQYSSPGTYIVTGAASNGESPSGMWTCPDYSVTGTVEYPRPPTAQPPKAQAPSNQPPVAVGNKYSVSPGRTLRVRPPGVLADDSDPDGPAPAKAVLKGIDFPRNRLVWNDDGSFNYQPSVDASIGSVRTIMYAAVDGEGAESGPVAIKVKIVKASGRGGILGGRPFREDDIVKATEVNGQLAWGFHYEVDWRSQDELNSAWIAGYSWGRWMGFKSKLICVKGFFQGQVTGTTYNSVDVPIDWQPLLPVRPGVLDGPASVLNPKSQSFIYTYPLCQWSRDGLVKFFYSSTAPITADPGLAGIMSKVSISSAVGVSGHQFQWTVAKSASRGGR